MFGVDKKLKNNKFVGAVKNLDITKEILITKHLMVLNLNLETLTLNL